MTQKITHAAVAVIQRGNGEVLLAQRPPNKPWAGWWEFPGGKIEEGETAEHALQRELQEELGISATRIYPWLTRQFDYPEKTVRLNFFHVTQWQGEPHGCEGQVLSWQHPAAISVSPLLPANQPIVDALNLPDVYAISNSAELGEVLFFERLQLALTQGLKLIQIREKHLDAKALQAFGVRVVKLGHAAGAKVLLNGDVALAKTIGADGVHFSSQALLALDARPADMLCAASCHDAAELAHAEKLGLDFVVLSPVLPTLSHQDAPTLGWAGFAALAKGYSLPVYALGGMRSQTIETAWQHGAHGVAILRAAWE